jgi:hypothetical protein
VTGFLCDDVGAAVRAVGRLDRLSRQACRETFERRFTAERMATNYVALYETLLHGSLPLGRAREAVS